MLSVELYAGAANLPAGQVTVTQVAEILGVKRSKVESLIRRGAFPTVLPDVFPFDCRRLLLDEVVQVKHFGRAHRSAE
ncbi:helix-turn-helix transcriptional regulator [Gemmata sp.]|uniref:helix-turn-helix transcriptional regulator n=1 Tax=Gemmata sp. TaxID=1914242 RepID=UPI003F6F3DEA